MVTLSKLRLYDWYAFRMEMKQYTRLDLLKKARELSNDCYYVYFIFEGKPDTPDFKPVYIGCTRSVYWRMVKHTHKIGKQTNVFLKAFDSKEEALQYEKRCIKAWQPRLNIQYNKWWQLDLIG